MSLSQALNKSQGGTNLIVDSLVVGGKPINGTVQQVVGSQYIDVITFNGVATIDNGGVIEVLGGTGISIGGAAQTPEINNTGVTAVNGLNGGVSFTSPQSTITITPNGQTIELEAVAVVPTNAVTSLNGLINAVSLSSSSITITPDINTGIIDLAVIQPVAVNSLQGLNGTVLLSSPLSTITIGTNGQTIELDAVFPPPPVVVDSLNGCNGTVSLTSSDSTITITPDILTSTVDLTFPPVFQATYYKSTAQTLTSGTTDITFDLTGSWNNVGGCITHVDGTTAFTVARTGVYQLGFNAFVNIGTGSWIAGSNKGISIDITRSPITEVAVIRNTAGMASASYTQSVSGTYYLVVGDVINLSLTNTFTNIGVTPTQALGFVNTFDLNTFFSWNLIS